MKYLLLFSMLIFSCKNKGLSESDKGFIQEMIKMHNTKAKTNFLLYLNQAESDARIKYINYPLKDSIIKLSMQSARLGYNHPYVFKKDTSVTMESYLAHCKAYGHDPKEYASRIDDN